MNENCHLLSKNLNGRQFRGRGARGLLILGKAYPHHTQFYLFSFLFTDSTINFELIIVICSVGGGIVLIAIVIGFVHKCHNKSKYWTKTFKK